MASEALDRAVRAVAATALRPEDARGRQSLRRLFSLWDEARTPFVLDGDGNGFAAALVVPAPKEIRSDRFHGEVMGLSHAGDRSVPLLPFRIPGAELGPGLAHAAAREAARGPGSTKLRFLRAEHELTAIAPGPAGLPGWDVLEAKVGEILRDRLAGRAVTLRLPFDCQGVEATRDYGLRAFACLGPGSGNRDARTLMTFSRTSGGVAVPAGRVKAGAAIARIPHAEVDWGGYAAALILSAKRAARADEAHLAASAASTFALRLDRMVVEAMREARSSSVALYGWLHANGDLRARLNRRQALGTYPVLAALTDKPALAAAIDEGRPLAPALAEAAGTSLAAVRRLQGVHDPDGSGNWGLLKTLPLATDVDPRHLPNPRAPERMEAQWAGLHDVCLAWRAMADAAVPHAGLVPGTVASRVATEPPLWQRAGGAERCRRLMVEGAHAKDFIGSFARHVLLPLALDACPAGGEGVAHVLQGVAATAGPDGRSPLSVALLRGLPMVDITRMSETWHERIDAIEAALTLGTAPEDISWPGLSHAFAAPNGIEAVPLVDPASLSAEGRALRHCVGSYVLECLNGPTHIVSLRRDGTSLSTVEIRLGDDGTLSVRQHMSHDNDAPPAESEAALDAYLAALRPGSLGFDPEGLAGALRERLTKPPGGATALTVGYDPSDPARRDIALAAYAFALPPGERGMGHAAWAEALDLPELVEASLRRHAGSYNVLAEFRRACDPEAFRDFEAWLKAGEGLAPVPVP